MGVVCAIIAVMGVLESVLTGLVVWLAYLLGFWLRVLLNNLKRLAWWMLRDEDIQQWEYRFVEVTCM